MAYKIPPVGSGISTGALVSIGFGWIYLIVLHEPGSAFYPFAALVFLGGPLMGGVVAMRKTKLHRRKAFLASSSVIFGIVCISFIFTYMLLPILDRTSVLLPAYCNGYNGSFNPPSQLAYTLPNVGAGVLITSDAQFSLVAMMDTQHPPFPATVYLINKSDNKIIRSMKFKNDVISATLDDGTLYMYNDKIGYFLDARTGEKQKNFFTIDNYGGLSQSDRPILSSASSHHWYLETTAVITSWKVDGSVKSRRHLTFNGIALGCFIDGDTHNVIALQ